MKSRFFHASTMSRRCGPRRCPASHRSCRAVPNLPPCCSPRASSRHGGEGGGASLVVGDRELHRGARSLPPARRSGLSGLGRGGDAERGRHAPDHGGGRLRHPRSGRPAVRLPPRRRNRPRCAGQDRAPAPGAAHHALRRPDELRPFRSRRLVVAGGDRCHQTIHGLSRSGTAAQTLAGAPFRPDGGHAARQRRPGALGRQARLFGRHAPLPPQSEPQLS